MRDGLGAEEGAAAQQVKSRRLDLVDPGDGDPRRGGHGQRVVRRPALGEQLPGLRSEQLQVLISLRACFRLQRAALLKRERQVAKLPGERVSRGRVDGVLYAPREKLHALRAAEHVDGKCVDEPPFQR